MAHGKEYSLGIDIGGTKVLATVFDEGMRPVATSKERTPTGHPASEFARMVHSVGEAAARKTGMPLSGFRAIGAAVAAPLDRKRGYVIEAPNMGLSDYPLRDELSRLFDRPVVLENDAQAGVLGELRAGALKGCRTAAGLFIGTGIGGGIVIDGQLYRGSTGSAGEFGHMTLLEGGPSCGCGGYGHLEALASRTSMAKDAAAAALAGKTPEAFAEAGTDLGKFRSSVFEKSVGAGETVTRRIVERSALWVGVALANIVVALNPEAIVLGGGVVMRFGESYRRAAERAMEERLMPGLAATVRILLSVLGDDAVAAGAAAAAIEAEGGGA
ncbi:MAG: ROK family protein [Spirochaetes bacterium]|nr:ROK family protein [Spirochaetota bacterium]